MSADYHSIYVLIFSCEILTALIQRSFPNNATSSYFQYHPTDLILRVSGGHIPYRKTTNECAILTYLSLHTSISVPRIVAYSASTSNPLKHEYQLVTRAPGLTVDHIYRSFTPAQESEFLDQIIDILEQLHALLFHHLGGLQFNTENRFEIVPGPVCEETFWQTADIEKYWNRPYDLHETVETLNIGGPYPTYVAYINAHITRYIYAITLHPLLSPMRDLVPRLQNFIEVLRRQENEWKLNDTRLVLAHRDLHFANIVYNPSAERVTGILDWEFSGVVPFPRWDPQRAFLWNGDRSNVQIESKQIKEAWQQKFADRYRERGVDFSRETGYSNEKQESMQKATNFVRAICEVVPRRQMANLVGGWRTTLEACLDELEA
ncbi:hypothetical protein MMC08_002579 [Hypocenomyce scalaris]|nr:hypothetical protein [Hypocenomyce scalaris]